MNVLITGICGMVGSHLADYLLEKTDYNTYKMSGLPLGPIANPSLAAIKAVLNPEDHDYIYFVICLKQQNYMKKHHQLEHLLETV